MRLSPLAKVSLVLFATGSASAQTADDYFNDGAQLYIAGQTPSALARVEGGLKAYPDDPKLKKLEALLKQQQQSQSKSSQSQKDQDSKDRQSQNAPQKQDSSGGQDQSRTAGSPKENSSPPPDSSGSQGHDQRSPSSAEQKPPVQQPAESAGPPAQRNAEAQAGSQGQMTPEEANRLLDAQKGDEQVLEMKPKGRPPESPPPAKDW